MPELPEVEVIRRELDRDVVGRKIKKVEVPGMRSIRRHPNKKHFIGLLEGLKVKTLERRGKHLLFGLDDGQTLIVHLGMSGQLLRARQSREKVAKHTHVIVMFTQGGQLRFRDDVLVPTGEVGCLRGEHVGHGGILAQPPEAQQSMQQQSGAGGRAAVWSRTGAAFSPASANGNRRSGGASSGLFSCSSR